MSSGFVTESEIAEAKKRRQEEWDKVRTPDQPLEAPEEVFDPRPLYQRLEEQKQKKDAEYEETHKLKNMIRGLDDDEVGFLDLVERTKAVAARKISLEEQREMAEFRERVSNLNEQAEKDRLAQQLKVATSKKPIVANNISKNKLQGLIVRKRKASDSDSKQNGDVNKDTNEHSKISKNDVTRISETAPNMGVMKCIGVLPGLGFYDNDSSDSERSSDSDEEGHKHEHPSTSKKGGKLKVDGEKSKQIRGAAILALF